MTGGEDELAERLLRCESNSPDRPQAGTRERPLSGGPFDKGPPDLCAIE